MVAVYSEHELGPRLERAELQQFHEKISEESAILVILRSSSLVAEDKAVEAKDEL